MALASEKDDSVSLDFEIAVHLRELREPER